MGASPQTPKLATLDLQYTFDLFDWVYCIISLVLFFCFVFFIRHKKRYFLKSVLEKREERDGIIRMIIVIEFNTLTKKSTSDFISSACISTLTHLYY